MHWIINSFLDFLRLCLLDQHPHSDLSSWTLISNSLSSQQILSLRTASTNLWFVIPVLSLCTVFSPNLAVFFCFGLPSLFWLPLFFYSCVCFSIPGLWLPLILLFAIFSDPCYVDSASAYCFGFICLCVSAINLLLSYLPPLHYLTTLVSLFV